MSEEPKTLREWCLEFDAPLLEEDLRQAADTIERLSRERDEARARVKVLEDALGGLMRAVCGETGFAECVRRDSGHAYPWPALEMAETAARTALQEQSK